MSGSEREPGVILVAATPEVDTWRCLRCRTLRLTCLDEGGSGWGTTGSFFTTFNKSLLKNFSKLSNTHSTGTDYYKCTSHNRALLSNAAHASQSPTPPPGRRSQGRLTESAVIAHTQQLQCDIHRGSTI